MGIHHATKELIIRVVISKLWIPHTGTFKVMIAPDMYDSRLSIVSVRVLGCHGEWKKIMEWSNQTNQPTPTPNTNATRVRYVIKSIEKIIKIFFFINDDINNTLSLFLQTQHTQYIMIIY